MCTVVNSFDYCALQGFCFGFVEFESASSMQSAIEVITTEFFRGPDHPRLTN